MTQTSEERVKSVYPKAYSHRWSPTSGGDWVIVYGDRIIGRGLTEREAWRNAAQILEYRGKIA